MMQVNDKSAKDTLGSKDVDVGGLYGSWEYNVEIGCRMLVQKFKQWTDYTVNKDNPYFTRFDTDPLVIENWYYAGAWYNGVTPKSKAKIKPEDRDFPDAYLYIGQVWYDMLQRSDASQFPMFARFFPAGIPALGDPRALGLPNNIRSPVPYPWYGVFDAYTTSSIAVFQEVSKDLPKEELIAGGKYTLRMLVEAGERIHRWDNATSTARDITEEVRIAYSSHLASVGTDVTYTTAAHKETGASSQSSELLPPTQPSSEPSSEPQAETQPPPSPPAEGEGGEHPADTDTSTENQSTTNLTTNQQPPSEQEPPAQPPPPPSAEARTETDTKTETETETKAETTLEPEPEQEPPPHEEPPPPPSPDPPPPPAGNPDWVAKVSLAGLDDKEQPSLSGLSMKIRQ